MIRPLLNSTLVKKSSLFLFLLLFVLPVMLFASRPKPVASSGNSEKSGSFNAGEMIMEHVNDAHSWHIADIGHHHITVHLPVILLCEGKITTFCSSKIENPGHSYKGFTFIVKGHEKGKFRKQGSKSAVYDFSITKNVLALFISVAFILLIFISIARKYRKAVAAPSGLQSWIEPLILFIRDDIAKASIGEKKYEKYMPYLLTLFFFIFINNLLGLVPFFPGGANLTGNIAVTAVMAFFTFIITSFSANKQYWVHIVNTPGVPWWLKVPVPLMPIVELIGVFTKPFVLMVRLFANITAGHIIVLGFVSIIFIFGGMVAALGYGVSVVSISFMVFMGLLELLVAFIQAYVFTLLSALYVGMAVEDHEHH